MITFHMRYKIITPAYPCVSSMQLAQWLHRKRERYCSHDIQNELLKCMALRVQREIVSRLHASQFFTIMVDECTDVTNKEQVGFSYMFNMWCAQSM